jgi:hypothetical protein
LDEAWLPPLQAGPTALLIGLEWYAAGEALVIVDPVNRVVERYAEWMVPDYPIGVIPDTGTGFRVAMQGRRYEVREMEWEWSLVLLDSAGNRLWEHRLPTEPTSVVPGADGTVIVSSTLTRKRWEDYHKWQDLSKDNYVRCLAPDGTARWTWYAPAWLSHLPRIGSDGFLYTGSAGRMWILPAG